MDSIRAILNQDPVWSAYALADLQPAFAPYCRWQVTYNGAGPGVVLLYAGFVPEVLFSAGAPPAVSDALAQAELPGEVYITIPEAHLPAVARHYDLGATLMPMWRMAYTGQTRPPAPSMPVARLQSHDAARIEALYAHGGPYTPDAFDPVQLREGVFYGVEDGAGDLLAVGGTHIVDWQAAIAAIGNMYTRPDCRGQGLASAVLHAIVGELQDRGASTIVLNVAQANAPARRIYERHGFTVHCPYLEGVGRKTRDQ